MGTDMCFMAEIRFPTNDTPWIGKRTFTRWVGLNPRYFGEDGRHMAVGLDRNYDMFHRLTGIRDYNGREMDPVVAGVRPRGKSLTTCPESS